jgi:hypothetical protein
MSNQRSKKKLAISPDLPCAYKMRKRINAKPDARFVLQIKYSSSGKPEFVCQTEPIEDSADPKLAVKFAAGFLNTTVWDWDPWYDAIPATEHASRIQKRRKLAARVGAAACGVTEHANEIKRRRKPRRKAPHR